MALLRSIITRCVHSGYKYMNLTNAHCCAKWVQPQPLKSLTLTRYLSCTMAVRTDDEKNLPPESKPHNFQRIYLFPYVRFLRLFLRMKIYQTGLTALAIPPSVYLYANNLISGDALQANFGVAGFAACMLFVMSKYVKNTIGLISLSDDEQMVRIAHLSFWGNREDTYVEVDNVVPLMDLPDNPSDIYIKFRRYDSKEEMLLCVKYGGIEHLDKFEKVFGKMSVYR